MSWDIVGILIGLAALFLCCLLLLLLFFCCRGQQTEKLYVYQVPDLPSAPSTPSAADAPFKTPWE